MQIASPSQQQRTDMLAIQRVHTRAFASEELDLHVCQPECRRGAREPGLGGLPRIRRGKPDIQGHISSHGSCISVRDLRASGDRARPGLSMNTGQTAVRGHGRSGSAGAWVRKPRAASSLCEDARTVYALEYLGGGQKVRF